MVFDPIDPVIDKSKYQKRYWTSSEFGNVKVEQELPRNMPQPREIDIRVRAKVASDHASEAVL